MRDLLFKNITSENKRQRILSSSELIEHEGVRTAINRHLICRIQDIDCSERLLPAPALYVLKKRDTKTNTEAFYCRIKGFMHMAISDKLYLVNFIHSLRIKLKVISIPVDK